MLSSPLNSFSSLSDLRAGAEQTHWSLIQPTVQRGKQLECWAGTWSAETSRVFQEVQHQGSACVIDLAEPTASTIPPLRGSLTAQVHICVCVQTRTQCSVVQMGGQAPVDFCYSVLTIEPIWTIQSFSFSPWNTRTLYHQTNSPLVLCSSYVRITIIKLFKMQMWVLNSW